MNKFEFLVVFVIFCTAMLGVVVYYEENPVVHTITEVDVQQDILAVLTNPEADCKAFTLQWLAKANSTIKVAMYAFDSENIAMELVSAKNRGLDVKVLFDVSTLPSAVYTLLDDGGVAVKNYTKPSGNMIVNVCVIDETWALVGTYTWTEWGNLYDDTALLLIKGPSVVKLSNKFNELWLPSGSSA
jgi:phosphatidylserine/phosphatidylglycerophosphate/cardiolipin synthase-like enzyme